MKSILAFRFFQFLFVLPIEVIEEEISDSKEFILYQNYPYPFNPSTNIRFDFPEDNFVTIKVYDILGKEDYFLVNEFKQSGSYLV